MKKNLLIIILIFTICIFGVTFAYFGLTSNTNQEFKTDNFEASTYDTFVSPSNWQPGDTNEKIVNVKNIGNVDMAVRISLEEQWKSKSNQILSNTQNNESIAVINLVNTSDWIKEGNYYYYKYRLVKNDTTSNFMNRVTFNENINFDTNCIRVNNINNCSYTIGDYDGATYTLNIKIETIQYNKYKNVWNTSLTLLDEKIESGVESLVKKSNGDNVSNYSSGNIHEMYTFNHEETLQTSALTDYRFIGNDPYNYVYFNCTNDNDLSTCEIWRILGVFETDKIDPNDSDKIITESRIKLVRGELLTNYMSWDSLNVNDWTNSSLKKYLNENYFESFSDSSKLLIDDAIYYLGGRSFDSQTKYGSTEEIYLWERGKNAYKDRPIIWSGKVSLMYPSDEYMVYGKGVNDNCYLSPYVCNINDGEFPDTGWIYNSNLKNGDLEKSDIWLISPLSNDTYYVYATYRQGHLSGYFNVKNSKLGVRPVIYLSSDVKIKSGTGASGDPYVLSI